MRYRKFGSLDFEVSALGFGCMRFPMNGEKEVDLGRTTAMLRRAVDSGMNYLDTAYTYHKGQSEAILGEALKDGYRNKVRIATKLPPWHLNAAEDFDKILDGQLKNLRTDHVDFYLFHALNRDYWENKVLKYNLLEKAAAAKRAGKINHLGFSFHDEYDVFTEIINGFDQWDFCQIQYNYYNVDYQAGAKGLKYAADRGLAVIIMEPLLGGRLSSPPKPVADILERAESVRTPTDWALQWLWNQPGVSLVLSGMGDMKQVDENLRSADKSGIGTLTESELEVIERARKKFDELTLIPCTRCRYCMPCPAGVNIPKNFEMFNEGSAFDKLQQFRDDYKELMENDRKSAAVSCEGCGACEKKCPQNIKIRQWLSRIHAIWDRANRFKMIVPPNL